MEKKISNSSKNTNLDSETNSKIKKHKNTKEISDYLKKDIPLENIKKPKDLVSQIKIAVIGMIKEIMPEVCFSNIDFENFDLKEGINLEVLMKKNNHKLFNIVEPNDRLKKLFDLAKEKFGWIEGEGFPKRDKENPLCKGEKVDEKILNDPEKMFNFLNDSKFKIIDDFKKKIEDPNFISKLTDEDLDEIAFGNMRGILIFLENLVKKELPLCSITTLLFSDGDSEKLRSKRDSLRRGALL